MSKEAWISKRFWFGVGSIMFGALVTAFGGDPDAAMWLQYLVKLFGVGSIVCGGAVSLLQNSDIKAKGVSGGTSTEIKAVK